MAAGPLGRSGRLILEALGIIKTDGNFLRDLSQTVQPTVNVTPYYLPETYQELQFTNAGFVLGHNIIYTNSTGQTQYLIGGAVFSGAVGAGVTIELRMSMFSPGATPFYAVLTPPDLATGASELCVCGATFFDSPLVLPPNWGVGCFLSSVTGAVPNISSRLLISAPN